MGSPVISPELALVCPELAERARAALPVRDPDAFLSAPAAGRTAPAEPSRSPASSRARQGLEVHFSIPFWAVGLAYLLARTAQTWLIGMLTMTTLTLLLTAAAYAR